MKPLRTLAGLLFLATTAWAQAALNADLGKDLQYLRVTTPAEDAAAVQALNPAHSAVVDLRFLTAESPAIEALSRALAATPPRQGTLRVLLVNTETAPALRQALTPAPRQLVLGPAREGLRVDLAIKAAAEEERRAFEALAAGTAAEKLISNNAEKRRFDEAALMRTHNGDGSLPDPSEDPPAPSEDQKTEAAPLEPPPFDAVLQRAVQLHRALVPRS